MTGNLLKEYVLLEEDKVWGGDEYFGSTKEKPVMIHNIMVMMMLQFINKFHNKSWVCSSSTQFFMCLQDSMRDT